MKSWFVASLTHALHCRRSKINFVVIETSLRQHHHLQKRCDSCTNNDISCWHHYRNSCCYRRDKKNQMKYLLCYEIKMLRKKSSKSELKNWNRHSSTHDAIHFDSISQHGRDIWNCITLLLLFLSIELQCFKATRRKHKIIYKTTLLRYISDML